MVNNSPQGKQAAQLMADNYSSQQLPMQRKENKTGLPNVQLQAKADNYSARLQQQPIQKKASPEPSRLMTNNHVAQLGRTEKLGSEKTIIKLVLPGSGDPHWRTRTEEEKGDMHAIPSETGQQSWTRIGTGGNVEFTIAGPQALGGLSDTGANSIKNNIALGIELVKEQIQELSDWQNPNTLTVLIKAHSRNAVAGSQIAQKLRSICYDIYGFDDSPEVELVMFDPVPGPWHSGELVETDVGIVDQSTVVYSFSTQYPIGFAPQKITGAKRMIISKQDHGVGTNTSFSYAGKVYKGSNLNSLPAGVFVGVGIIGGIEKITKILSTGELERILNQANSFTTQTARLKTIEEVAKGFDLVITPPGKAKDARFKD
jgi:hypothetical protein